MLKELTKTQFIKYDEEFQELVRIYFSLKNV